MKSAAALSCGCRLGRLRAGHQPVERLHPAHQVQVPESSGIFLDIRFQVIDGALGLGVAFARQPGQAAHQTGAFTGEEAREAHQLPFEEILIAHQEALVEQADGEFQVPVMHAAALFRSAHGLAEAQPGIPQLPQEAGQRFLLGRGHRVALNQNQQIDIGVGK